MSRSTNKAGPPLQVALLGASGTGTEQLIQALLTSGMNAKICTSINEMARFQGPILLAGLESHNDTAQLQEDHDLRTELSNRKVAYLVLYGTQQQRLEQVLRIVDDGHSSKPVLPAPPNLATLQKERQAWVWVCDKCSDPECEHRLLTGLLESRKGPTEQLP